jgi:hypothetical protein
MFNYENELIAREIYKQLGGQKFRVMTGAKHLSHGNDKIGSFFMFKIGRNKSRANYIQITLNGKDLYNMDFKYVNKNGIKYIERLEDIYCDQLQETFTRVTGMYTHL